MQVWVSESVPVWAPQLLLSGHLGFSFHTFSDIYVCRPTVCKMAPNHAICCLYTVLACRPIVCRPKKSPKLLTLSTGFLPSMLLLIVRTHGLIAHEKCYLPCGMTDHKIAIIRACTRAVVPK